MILKEPSLLAPEHVTSCETTSGHNQHKHNTWFTAIIRVHTDYSWQLQGFMIIKRGRHIFGEIYEVRKGLWALFLIVLSGCWLTEQANSNHMDSIILEVWNTDILSED